MLHRVLSLSSVEPAIEEGNEIHATDGYVRHTGGRPPFIRLVPLVEIIAETMGQGPSTHRVEAEYRRLTEEVGSELQVLREISPADLERLAGEKLAQGVIRARLGEVRIDPGYDGVYGKISVWPQDDPSQGQQS